MCFFKLRIHILTSCSHTGSLKLFQHELPANQRKVINELRTTEWYNLEN